VPQPIALLVLIEVQPGKSAEQVRAFQDLAPLVLAEPGCLQYELNRVAGDEDMFVLVEKWASEEALAAHDATPHMVAADAHSPSFRARPATLLRLVTVS
jgi:quinol monooxygenase YgiN